jgi:hypothetical protein
MKRIRVAQGKHVTISAELAEKAARVCVSGLARALKGKRLPAVRSSSHVLKIGDSMR